jgi:hypothetical protein
MRIGWHAWEPALTTGKLSSAGGDLCLKTLLDHFGGRNTNVWMPNETPPRKAEAFDGKYDKLDVAFMMWRWHMPLYPERDALYVQQNEHIRRLVDAHVPVIVHDQDLNISAADRDWLIDLGVTITEPSFFPSRGASTLMFPHPFNGETSLIVGVHRDLFLSFYTMLYVGNNYGRFEPAVRFLGPFSKRFKTKLYGNWLEPHPERESPEVVKAALPNVEFGERFSHSMIVQVLAESDLTIHMVRPIYAAAGLMGPRWGESIAAKTLAFIPAEFGLPDEWRERLGGVLVADGNEMIAKFESMSERQYIELLRIEEELVRTVMTIDGWDDIVRQVKGA